MTATKKLVSVLLAMLMAFSAFSVLGSAITFDPDTGYAVVTPAGAAMSIQVKFVDSDENELDDLSTVTPGDSVKARVYLGTDYYSTSGEIMLYYNSDFFSTAYTSTSTSLTLNSNNTTVSVNQVTANARVSSSDSSADETALSVVLYTDAEQVFQYNSNDWLFELELTVLQNGTASEGSVYAKDADLCSPDNPDGPNMLPYGESGDDWWSTVDLYMAQVASSYEADTLTTDNTAIFDANGGHFENAAVTTKSVPGRVGAVCNIPAAPTRDGYTFLGWTLDNADAFSAADTTFTMPVTKDVTYLAKWNENVIINFADTGTPALASYEVSGGTAWNDKPDVSDNKEGYKFLYWEGEGVVNGQLPDNYPVATVDGNEYTYTAVWAKLVRISFDADGGTFSPAVDPYYEGDDIYAGNDWDPDEVPTFDVTNYANANVTRTGYALVGWQVNGGEIITEFPDEYPDENTVYKAVWRAKNVRIIYVVDPNAASAEDVNIATATPVKSLSVPYGSTYTLVPYSDDDGTVNVWVAETNHAEYAPNSDASIVSPLVTMTNGNPDILYFIGVIAPDVHVATFDPDGGTWDDDTTAAKQKSFNANQAITAPGTLTKSGYTFDGWSPDLGIMGSSDVSFTAVWTPIDYTVSYMRHYDDDDINEVDTISFSGDQGIEYPQDPVREGYDFIGWFTDKAGTTEFTTLPADETSFEVYAKWEIQSYTVTYDVNGGSAVTPGSVDVVFDADIPDEPDTAKEGYTLSGWVYTDEDDAVYTGATMPAYDLTATAQWTANTYKINYVKNGGNWVQADTLDYDIYTYGTDTPEVRNADDIRKTGSEFKNVTLDSEGNTVFTGDWAQILANAAQVSGGQDNEYELNVYVQWDLNKYNLTVDLDGGEFGDGVTSPAGEYYYGDTLPAMPAATKTGYSPAEPAWVYTNTETGDVINPAPATMPEYDVTATALWTINTYTITYDVNGGDALDPEDAQATVVYNTPIPEAPEVSCAGKTFDGWVYTDEDDETFTGTSMPASDLTATAQWTANTYIINYVPNEGTWKSGVTGSSDTYVYDSAVTVRDDSVIEKTGYEFDKVTIDAAGNTEFTGDWSQIIANAALTSGTTYSLTVYVQWNILQYSYTLNPDGGVIEDGVTYTPSGDYDYNTPIVTPPDDSTKVTKTGYTFDGWVYTKTGSDPVETISEPERMPAYDVTATAQWRINQYKVTVNPDGGSIELLPEGWATVSGNYVFEDDYNTPVPALGNPTKTGYTFTGWDVSIPTTVQSEDVTVTATWQKHVYNIAYNMDGGTPQVAATTAEYGDTITLPVWKTDFDKEGYTFNGWEYSGTNYTSTFNVPALETSGETITFTAKWSVNSYQYTLNLDGGSVDDGDAYTVTGSYDYGTQIILPADSRLKKTGFTFAGWDKTNPGTMPAEDLIITALWLRNDYEVTYVFKDENGETIPGASKQSATVLFEDSVDVSNPDVYGFDFVNWEASPALLTGNKMPADDVTVTFNYTAHTHTLTVRYVDAEKNAIDGETDYTATVAYNKPVDLPALKNIEHYHDPVIEYPEGYTAGDPMPDSNLTILYVYTLNTNTLMFTVDGDVKVNEEVAYGADITGKVPEVTPATGYKWEGKWYSDAGCNTETSIPATMPDSELKIYTKTVKDSFVLTWVIGDIEIKSGEVVFEEPIDNYKPTDSEIAAFAPSGKYFAGEWSSYDTMPASATTITGSWSDEEYTFTFVDNTAYDVTNNTADKTVIATDAYSVLPAPAVLPEGHKFTGYEDVNTGTVYNIENNGATLFGDLGENGDTFTVKPVYAKLQFSIAYYDSDNTTVLETITADYDDAIVPTTASVTPKTGYTMLGTWTYKTEAGVVCDPQPTTYPAENLKAYRDFSINTYKFIFHDEQQGTVTAPIEEEYGTPITKPSPTKPGWAFEDWYTDSALNNRYTWPGNMPALGDGTNNQTMDLYAKWTPADAHYTITVYTMDTDGVNYTAAEPRQFGGTSDDVLTRADLVNKIGAPATGFEVNETLSAASFTVAEDANYDLYIDRSTYTYTLDLDGGAFEAGATDPSGSYVYGQAVATTDDEPVKTNYHFKGWSDALITEMPAENVTITAQWKHYTTIKVYFDEDASDLNSTTVDVEQGDTITPRAADEKPGHNFVGWATDPVAAPADAVMTITAGTEDSAVYYPIYKAREYTLTFTLNAFNTWDGAEDFTAKWADNTTADIVIPNVPYDTDLSTLYPGEPSRTGYEFNLWVVPNTGLMPDDDLTVLVDWEAHEHNIYFKWKDNDGVVHDMPDATVEDIQFGDPDVSGYSTMDEPGDRDGWQWTDNWVDEYGTYIDDYEYMPDSDLVFYAEYEVLQFSYTLDLDDGTVADGDEYTESGEYDYGTAIVLPEDDRLSKAGFDFSGWVYTDDEDEEVNPVDKIPAYDLTVTAQWEKHSYTISYDVDGGSPELVDTTVDFEDRLYVPDSTEVTKPGYILTGWKTAGDDTLYTDVYTVPAQPNNGDTIVLKAQWQILEFSITVDPNGGEIEDLTEGWTTVDGKYVFEADYNTFVPALDNPVRTGYDFAGWSEPVPANVPAEHKEITASWTKHVYNIRYDMDGGSPLIPATTAEFESTVNLPSADEVSRNGYTFTGWKAEGDNTLYVTSYTVPAQPRNGDTIVLKAQWSLGSFKVTVNPDGGVIENLPEGWSEDENGNYIFTGDYGTPVPALDEPTRPGYDLAPGWSTLIPTEVPEDDAEITVQWTKHKYTVVFLQPDDGATAPVFDNKEAYETRVNVEFEAGTTAPADYPELTYYHPAGWATEPDGEAVDFNTWTMPAAPFDSEFCFYPIYERDDIELVTVGEGPDIVDYDGDLPISGFIYNAGTKLTKDALREKLDVTGDGDIRITPSMVPRICGTGTKIELIDRVTDKPVKVYYLIVPGDVNGDAACASNDLTAAKAALKLGENATWSIKDAADATEEQLVENAVKRECRRRAADIADQYGVFNSDDTERIELFLLTGVSFAYDKEADHYYTIER